LNTVTALTCPDCGALGLDCEPSSEDGALYNCPECGFYRTYEISSEEDWQEAETELEEEWMQVQSLSTDSPRVAAVVEYLRDNPPSTADVRNQQFVRSGWSSALDQIEDLLVDEETLDLIDYRDVTGQRHNVSHYIDSIASVRNIRQEVEGRDWDEDLQNRIDNQIRQRKLAMQSLADEIQDLEEIEEEYGGENQ